MGASAIVQAAPKGTHGCSEFDGETARYIRQFGTTVDIVFPHMPLGCLGTWIHLNETMRTTGRSPGLPTRCGVGVGSSLQSESKPQGLMS